MNVLEYINQKKELQNYILTYIDDDNEGFCDEDEEIGNNFKSLIKFINDKQISNNREELYEFLLLLSKIINNHHRSRFFSLKIKQILKFLEVEIKQTFTNIEIFEIFKKSLIILPFLFDTQILIFDEQIFLYFINEILSTNELFLFQYFLPEMKPFIPTLIKYLKEEDKNEKNYEEDDNDVIINGQKMIKKLIDEGSKEISPDFDKNRQKGENDSRICEIIRNDLIDDFIVYVNKTNISLSSELKPSKFETNQIILENEQKLTLIEYSAFFGSIKIFNYLRINGVEVTINAIKYGIHSHNAELIMLFEENFYLMSEFYLKESIKCHHNDFASYIKDNIYLKKKFNYEDQYIITKYCIHYCNYDFLSYENEAEIDLPINFIIQYDHIKLFKILYIKNDLKTSDDNDSLLKLAGQHGSHEIIQFLIEQPEYELKEKLFDGCKKLTRIHLPSTIKQISKHSFSRCTSLIEVSFSEGTKLEKIDDYAFFYCISLQRLSVIPSTTKVIGYRAFEGCLSLKDIQFEDIDNLEIIGKNAFDKTLIKKPIKKSKYTIQLKTTEQDSDTINLPFFKRVKDKYNSDYMISLIGDSNTGKTSIINKCIDENLEQFSDPNPTVMPNVSLYNKAHIWDTPGQKLYRSLVPSIIRSSDAIIIVFDILNQDSLESLNNWFEMAHNVGNPSCEFVLVRNKSDLDRNMLIEDAETIASNEKVSYFEVSAKTGSGVKELFSYIDTKIDIKTHFIEIK